MMKPMQSYLLCKELHDEFVREYGSCRCHDSGTAQVSAGRRREGPPSSSCARSQPRPPEPTPLTSVAQDRTSGLGGPTAWDATGLAGRLHRGPPPAPGASGRASCRRGR
jgi:hypothetical protein